MWNCRTYQGADISSDHSLVMAKIQVRLKGKRQRNMTVKRDISALKQEQIRQDFMNRGSGTDTRKQKRKGCHHRRESKQTEKLLNYGNGRHTTSAEKTEETVHNKQNPGTVG